MTNLQQQIKPWIVTSSEKLIQSVHISVSKEEVHIFDGEKEKIIPDYYVIEKRNYSAVVGITQSKKIVFVAQYRRGIDCADLELPAGIIEKNEDPAETAVREFEEETGYHVIREKGIVKLGTFSPDPPRSHQVGHGFLVHVDETSKSSQHLDDTEGTIKTILLSIEDVWELINKNDNYEGVTEIHNQSDKNSVEILMEKKAEFFKNLCFVHALHYGLLFKAFKELGFLKFEIPK